LSEKHCSEGAFDGAALRENYSSCIAMMSPRGIQGAPWNKFFDLRVIREKAVEYPPLRRHQDEGFIARYMCHAKKVRFIDELLYTYYVNDLQKEWQKYPVDYIDAVMGLYATRKETILSWNPDDTATHDMIEREYICNVIKAMELTFSPKHNLSAAARRVRLQEMAAMSALAQCRIPDCLGKYQRCVMQQLVCERKEVLYRLLQFKVMLQKSKLFSIIHKG